MPGRLRLSPSERKFCKVWRDMSQTDRELIRPWLTPKGRRAFKELLIHEVDGYIHVIVIKDVYTMGVQIRTGKPVQLRTSSYYFCPMCEREIAKEEVKLWQRKG